MKTIHPMPFFKAKWKWLKTSLKIDRVDPTRYSLVYILVAFVSHSFYCRGSLLASLIVACWIEVWGWRPGGNVVVVGLIGFYPCWNYLQHKRLVVWTWSNKLCTSYFYILQKVHRGGRREGEEQSTRLHLRLSLQISLQNLWTYIHTHKRGFCTNGWNLLTSFGFLCLLKLLLEQINEKGGRL